MNLKAGAARLWADVAFILARLLFGVGAYVLLAFGLILGVAVVLGLGFAALLLLPLMAGAAAVGLAAFVARPFSASVRDWLARRPLRRAARRAAGASAQGLAAVTVWWLLATRATARRERAAAAAHDGVDIPIAYRPLPDGHAPTLRVVMTDPATWRDLAHLVVWPLYAVAACLLIGAVWVGGVVLLATAPSVGSSASWTDPTTWLTVAAAIGMLVAAPFITHAVARGATAVSAGLLSSGEGARMRAELDEQRLRRQLAVDAAERERRRIERDLHDGAQQRLVALGMTLGLARETLPTDPAAGAALVAEAHAEAKLAFAELRDLARGIHPAILADRGLDAALSDLLRRTPVPVSIFMAVPHRPPTSVESAAYFVVAEALTNVSRHAAATRATVSITQADGLLLVEVTDNGGGGADPTAGTGLTGLADRVAALNGRLTVDSPHGGPTTIRAEIPCAS